MKNKEYRLLSLPTNAVARVFKDYFLFGKQITDLVRAFEIAISAGFLAFGDQLFDLVIENAALFDAKYTQHGLVFRNGVQHGCLILGFQLVFCQERIYLAYKVVK